MKPTLSVIIITKNEETRLEPTLRSVGFADEIIVLDSGSSDGTLELARRYTDKVEVNADWQGFGIQKNRALAQASGDWVLSVDADERVIPALRDEILAAIGNPSADVYEVPILGSYCGREIRHSGWWPDYKPRLFRRGGIRFTQDKVHERLDYQGPLGRLHSPLQHESVRTLEEVLDKVNRYSTAGAEQAHARGKQGGLGKAVLHGVWAFLRAYVVKRGFLDGREGFILAVSSAEGTYYRYLKLMYLRAALTDELP